MGTNRDSLPMTIWHVNEFFRRKSFVRKSEAKCVSRAAAHPTRLNAFRFWPEETRKKPGFLRVKREIRLTRQGCQTQPYRSDWLAWYNYPWNMRCTEH
jgi:hypothetical protein